MFDLVYGMIMALFDLALKVKAWYTPGIDQWNELREKHFLDLKNLKQSAGQKPIIWMHCASLGEYEQGIPYLKNMKNENQDKFYLISFFSPSGYEQRSDNEVADATIYLPIDKKANMKYLVETLRPELFIGVKYEFWYQLLKALQSYGAKIIYISVVIRSSNFIFTSLGKPYLSLLKACTGIYTQDQESYDTFKIHGLNNIFLSKDTRIERVKERYLDRKVNEALQILSSVDKPIIIYASIYPKDLDVIGNKIDDKNYFHIVVPHDVSKNNLNRIEKKLKGNTPWLSHGIDLNSDVLLVDIVGLLFDLYYYANFVYVGGGFGRGIHNTLEPCVYGLPICFGPRYEAFPEAVDFVNKDVALVVKSYQDFENYLLKYNNDLVKKEVKIRLQKWFELID